MKTESTKLMFTKRFTPRCFDELRTTKNNIRFDLTPTLKGDETSHELGAPNSAVHFGEYLFGRPLPPLKFGFSRKENLRFYSASFHLKI